MYFIIVATLVQHFTSCSTNKYCVQFAECKKKYGITFSIVTDSSQSSVIVGTIYNQSGRSIKLEDNLKIFFYKYNQNLNTPFHDSVYKSHNSIVDFVELSGEIIIMIIPQKEIIEIRNDSTYSFKINKTSFESLVLATGNADNNYQLRKGFQLFVSSSIGRNGKFHLASNLFTL